MPRLTAPVDPPEGEESYSQQLERWAERLNSARATRKKKRQHIAYVRRLTGGT